MGFDQHMWQQGAMLSCPLEESLNDSMADYDSNPPSDHVAVEDFVNMMTTGARDERCHLPASMGADFEFLNDDDDVCVDDEGDDKGMGKGAKCLERNRFVVRLQQCQSSTMVMAPQASPTRSFTAQHHQEVLLQQNASNGELQRMVGGSGLIDMEQYTQLERSSSLDCLNVGIPTASGCHQDGGVFVFRRHLRESIPSTIPSSPLLKQQKQRALSNPRQRMLADEDDCLTEYRPSSFSPAISDGNPVDLPAEDFVYSLPLSSQSSDSIPRVAPEALHAVLTCDHNSDVALQQVKQRLLVVDCRYPYEYDGGHIPSAINVCMLDDISHLLFGGSSKIDELMSEEEDEESSSPSSLAQSPASDENDQEDLCAMDECRTPELTIEPDCIIVFHCEFSSERAPRMARHVRQFDRALNAEQYPRLFFPEVYILEGGYKRFFEEFPQTCSPPHSYLPMRHCAYRNELRHYQKLKNNGLSSRHWQSTVPMPMGAMARGDDHHNQTNCFQSVAYRSTTDANSALRHSHMNLSSDFFEDVLDQADEVMAASQTAFL